MRLAVPVLMLTIAVSAAGQEKPKQSPFVFEMPKAAEPAKPKDESKSKEAPAAAPTTPAAAASTTTAAPAAQPVSAPSAAPTTVSTPAVPTAVPATPTPTVAPVVPTAAPAEAKPAATASAVADPRKSAAPDPLDFRLPSSKQAPAKGHPKKRNPLTFELPEPKSDATRKP